MATQSSFPVYCTRLEEVVTEDIVTVLLECYLLGVWIIPFVVW